MELLSLSATRMAQMIRERQISSVDLVQAHLDRIAEVNPKINAAIEVFGESALAEARAADAVPPRGPLHGVPFSVKDSIAVAGHACTAGTLGRKHSAPAAEDATLVARLRAAGAIPIARTNLPDLLFAFESDNLLFGATKNPHDLSRTSGGSSGGEAALIAAGGSPMGLGSDAAGSVRLPAAFCGIAAIKPTSGRLPRTGHVPPAGGWIEALWQIGPMARRVEDLVTMMPLLAGTDGCDQTCVSMPVRDPGEVDVRKLRVAFYTDNGIAAAGPEVARVVRTAAARLNAFEDRPGCLDQAYELEMKFLGPDGGDGLWRYLEAIGSTSVHPLLAGWLEKLRPYRTDVAGFAGYWAELDRFRAGMFAFLQRYDAIVCPVYPQPALPLGASIEDENFRGFSHTMAYNLTGWPAAVVRCGESESGLPIAVQVVAAPWREDLALAVAGWLENQSLPWAG